MKLKVWAEAILIFLASVCILVTFADGLIASFFGFIGAMILCVPLAKYGRIVNKENERK